MDKEKEQQRFLELSALFNKNNAIKHIMLLEQKLADYESNLVEAPVSPTEPTFTQKQILQLVREELQEAFEDDYAPEELKDKIYTVHGYILGAIRRGEVRG